MRNGVEIKPRNRTFGDSGGARFPSVFDALPSPKPKTTGGSRYVLLTIYRRIPAAGEGGRGQGRRPRALADLTTAPAPPKKDPLLVNTQRAMVEGLVTAKVVTLVIFAPRREV